MSKTDTGDIPASPEYLYARSCTLFYIVAGGEFAVVRGQAPGALKAV